MLLPAWLVIAIQYLNGALLYMVGIVTIQYLSDPSPNMIGIVTLMYLNGAPPHAFSEGFLCC